MNLKKLFTVVSACAVAVISTVAMMTNVNAQTVVGKAMLYGMMGTTYSQLDEAEAQRNGSTVANIDGNAQYEATWNITGGGASSISLLALQISGAENSANFTSAEYPNLQITIDEVYVDGVKVNTYETNANSVNTKYFKDNVGMSRVYLSSTLDTPQKCEDLPTNTIVTQQIKVLFTVLGLNGTGTSNVTSVPAATTAATEATMPQLTLTPPDTTPTDVNNQNGGFENNNTTTNIPSTTTGDGGVAAVAISGLAVTLTAAVLSKVKFKKKKK